jgi:PhzF family phenazine biosynthesis protein
MSIPIFHVAAFADKPFVGNPAAVCLLKEEATADWMQSVAAEMNLPETAFVRPVSEGYELRWFTPTIEVDLCGHATLASAHTLWTEGGVDRAQTIRFHTKSGCLACNWKNDVIELDFPAISVVEIEPDANLLDVFAVRPSFVGKSKFDTLLIVESEDVVRAIKPDLPKLRQISSSRGVIVSSRSTDPDLDFISRYFAPAAGIDEDPVTGSAHCCLGPFWSARLGKTSLRGYQASRRGGFVRVRVEGERVVLGGLAITIVRGDLL